MFRFPNRCGRQVVCFLSTLCPMRRRNNFLSSPLVSKSKESFNRVTKWLRPSYSLRQFKILSCLSKEKQPDSSGDCNSVISKRRDVSNNPDVNCIDKSLENSTYRNLTLEGAETDYDRIVLNSQEFLGIEVFPEIFDKLPPKCSGCGAIFQSSFENKPGFIPENRNPTLSENKEENAFMSEIICSRCFNLKHYNEDTPPLVIPEAITNFLMHISRRKALILYNVDVMDIPGSFVPDILKLVGETKHVIVVCNKVDRLAVDGRPHQQMERIEMIVANEAVKHGLLDANIRDICIVSAKTGFGVDVLVKKINQHWKENSDIYIVGSNNSGKTTLFNLIVDLFTASRQTSNMLQRGTVGPSPGTTLSLLRYPITPHRFLRLQNRLRHGYSELKEKSKETRREVELDQNIVQTEMTKYTKLNPEKTIKSDSAELSIYRPQFIEKDKESDLRWLFDTPGVYNKNQITHLLTNEELKLLNPSLWFVPRTLILKPGKVLFIGGLARLDYLDVQRVSRSVHRENEDIPKASQSVFFTVFASPNLPIHVTSLEKADAAYKEHTGNNLLKVPCGEKERMERFPMLSGQVMEVTGVDWKQSAADIILSTVGWIAVTAGTGSTVSVKAYTPNGVGLFLRNPPLLPTCVRQRGRRGIPYMGHMNHTMYQATRKRSPSLVRILADEDSGTTQWMKVAEKKRKQQRSLVKFEKMKWHSLKRVGFSGKSNPTRYLDDYEGFQEIDDETLKGNEKKIETNVYQGLE